MLRIEVIGNLGADATLQANERGKFVSFRVAHTDKYTDSQGNVVETTQWVSATINNDGGRLLPYLKTGTKVFIRGRMSLRLFTGHDGRQHAGVNCQVQEIELCGGREQAPITVDSVLALCRSNQDFCNSLRAGMPIGDPNNNEPF